MNRAPRLAQRWMRLLLAIAGGLGLLALLAVLVDPQELLRLLQEGARPWLLAPFLLAFALLVALFGYRWRVLLGNRVGWRQALASALLSLGGNMVLPARGGDLLRVHQSHRASKLPHAEVLARLVVEKVLDLLAIAGLGLLAALWLPKLGSGSTVLLALTGTAFALGLGAVAAIHLFGELLLRALAPAFKALRAAGAFERHLVPLVRQLGERLVLRELAWPAILTVALWLGLYAPSYMLVAAFIGLPLAYPEALLVVFGGALGLMVPAAPSGLGTFHASVVSAFLLLQRPAAQGLLLATAIHLLYFVVSVLPAAALLGRWSLARPTVTPCR